MPRDAEGAESPGWVAGDSQPAPCTAVVGLGTPGWAGAAPPTFLLFTRVFVRESRGGLCIVSKRSPALSHANAALKAAPCQTDEIVALFRLLPDGRRGKGPQHPQPGLGDRLCPTKTSGSPHPSLGSGREWERMGLGWPCQVGCWWHRPPGWASSWCRGMWQAGWHPQQWWDPCLLGAG